jgi:hypothetical protein
MLNKDWWTGFLLVFVIAGAIYLGFYLCFIRGLIQVAEAIKVTPVSTWQLIVGVIRVAIAGLVGWFSLVSGLAIVQVLLDINWRKK